MSCSITENIEKDSFYHALYAGRFTHGTFEEIINKLQDFLPELKNGKLIPDQGFIDEINKKLDRSELKEGINPSCIVDGLKLLAFFNLLQSNKYKSIHNLTDSNVQIRYHLFDELSYDVAIGLARGQDITLTNQVKIKNAKNFSKRGFDTIQKIRGDGNCYYTSVMKGYIELTIMETPEKRHFFFNRLAILIQTKILDKHPNICSPLSPVQQENIANFIKKIRLAADAACWTSLQEFWSELSDNHSQTYHLMILCARYLVAQAVIEQQALEINGLALFLSIPNDCKSVEEYVRQKILPMGECAEGVHVELSFLPKILGFPCDVYNNSSDHPSQKEILAEYRTSKFDTKDYPEVLEFTHSGQYHILLTPGHYDALLHRALEDKMINFEQDHCEDYLSKKKPLEMDNNAAGPFLSENRANNSEKKQNCLIIFMTFLKYLLKKIISLFSCCSSRNSLSP